MGAAVLVILALAAGCGLSLQAGINAELGVRTAHPYWAALASFVIGGVFLVPFVFAVKSPLPSLTTLGDVRWWAWTGGLLGAAYVVSTITVAPRLGAAPFFAFVVGGQMVMALLLDNYGLVGFAPHKINPLRLLGTALVVGGVVLIRRF